MRISIAWSMVVIFVIALSFAGLRNADQFWTGILLFLTLTILACSACGLAYRREASRAGWFGFAVFGWGYFVLTFGPYSATEVRSMLPTTQALAYLHARLRPGGFALLTTVYPPPEGTGIAKVVFTDIQPAGGLVTAPGPSAPGAYSFVERYATVGDNFEHFLRVGHCLFTLLVGSVGAMIARQFYRDGVPRQRQS
jgi:hypothetical protein